MEQYGYFYNQLMHYLIVTQKEDLIVKYDLDKDKELWKELFTFYPFETEFEMGTLDEMDFIKDELTNPEIYYGVFLELVKNNPEARKKITRHYSYNNNLGEVSSSTLKKIPKVLKELSKSRPHMREIRNKAGIDAISDYLYSDLVNNIDKYLY